MSGSSEPGQCVSNFYCAYLRFFLHVSDLRNRMHQVGRCRRGIGERKELSVDPDTATSNRYIQGRSNTIAHRNRFGVCPVGGFQAWRRMAFNSGDEHPPVFGPRLLERASAITKTAALENGALDMRIYTHILRAGGSASLYVQGDPLDGIHRWGSWRPMTSHQYLRRDATALGKLPEVVGKSHGLLKRTNRMNVEPKRPPFQQQSKITAGHSSKKPKRIGARFPHFPQMNGSSHVVLRWDLART